MKKISLFLVLCELITSAAHATCNLPAPSNVSSPSHTSCEITVTWNSVSEATGYKLRYKQKGITNWIKVNMGNVMTYTITGLIPHTIYKLEIASLCSNNNPGAFSNAMTVKTAKCPLSSGLIVSNITPHSALASWQATCSATVYVLRYKQTTVPSWIVVNNITTTSYAIVLLQAQTNYEVQVRSTCNADTSTWTASTNFLTLIDTQPVKANIVMIVLDDARYDAFKPTGGPSFLNYPSIDRIANEGVNFQLMIPTTSQCTPSRGTIVTGLYAHKHGAFFNGEEINPAIPEIQEILHDNGYFTGVIGKYYFSDPPHGFDWYAVSSDLQYINSRFQINGKRKLYTEHVTNVYTKLITDFFDSLPSDKPFMLMFWPIIPHGPTIPRDQDKNLYVNDTMPFPSNFFLYAHNYPSYYTDDAHTWSYSATQTDSLRRIEFQTQQGTEMNVDSILARLENRGILDSTLVMFTSDNGYLKGEHLMQSKQVALEESIRLPLFIRYPPWFAPDTVVTNEIASNMDIPVTILEAAGIPDTFHMDGLSLHKLYDGTAQRKDFYYELCSTETPPPLRAVRSLQYLYVYTFCDQSTEEFYDLVTDPHENTNQIFNPSYATIIQQYRNKKDSFRMALDDTLSSTRNCNLVHIQMKNGALSDTDDADGNGLYVFPDPANDFMDLQFFGIQHSSSMITIKNEMGETMLNPTMIADGWKNIQLDCSKWIAGVYFVTVHCGDEVRSGKMVVQH